MLASKHIFIYLFIFNIFLTKSLVAKGGHSDAKRLNQPFVVPVNCIIVKRINFCEQDESGLNLRANFVILDTIS